MSALRSELKTVLRIQVNTLPSLGKESEAACGWSVPGMFLETIATLSYSVVFIRRNESQLDQEKA